MRSQQAHIEQVPHPLPDTMADIEPGIDNPFPGLRPFTLDECHLFFGREGQTDEILVKLSNNRFVTVIGYSGSGKSSLMYCGLVPVLYGGFMTQTGPHWQVISSRPGLSPIQKLTESIVGQLVKKNKIAVADIHIHRSIINSVLRSSPNGLVDVARYLQHERDENIFILIDQFEELFRYREQEDSEEPFNEAQAYVNLILAAVQQTKVPVYIALTMRSDFIGSCSVFPGLTTLINHSNYLVPQMTREQKKMAIEGPVAVAGGKISKRLVKRLLNESSSDQDQLPIIQHALMRTWDYWLANRDPGEPIDIRHYNAIGRVSQALSQHANEAFEELSSREKEIAEVLFKSITEKRQDNRGNRRPSKISLLSELAEADENDVIKVVDHFRKSGRSFLMPASHIALTSESSIEISHESLMRIWTRLNVWVTDEYESSQMYKRLSDAAAMYQIGKTGLWRPPDLQLALNWQKKQKPTRVWAQRYDEAFERAVVFLDSSRITYEAELKNLEMLQKRQLRRAKVTAIILGTATVVSILFLFFGYTQRLEAFKQTEVALQQQKIAEQKSVEAGKARALAEQKQLEATTQKNRAEEALQKLRAYIKIVENALASEQVAKDDAQRNLLVAQQERDTAKFQKGRADENFKRAQSEFQRADKLLMLTKARAMAGVSIQMDDDKNLAGLLAKQSYIFNTRYEGKKYDPFIHNALYTALARIKGKTYNAMKVPGVSRNRINSVAISANNNTFYAAGADGRIYKGNLKTQAVEPTTMENRYPNRVVALSTDQKFLLNATDSSFVQIFDLQQQNNKPKLVEIGAAVNDAEALPKTQNYLVAAANGIWSVSTSGVIKKIVAPREVIKSLHVNKAGTFAIGGTWTGKLFLIDLQKNTCETIADEGFNRIMTVKFHPSDTLLAYGMEDVSNKRGLVKMMSVNTRIVTRQFAGHKAAVYDIEFSPDGELLASAGSDKRLQLWVLRNPEDLPVVMDNNDGFIWDIVFAKGSDYLLATTYESEIRVWPTDPAILQNEICNKLDRNMTRYEWETYVGKDIKQEITCIGLLIDDY
jgi:WD40 repeat protein/ABC-type oligopeptide transport system ATPase subunit